MFFAHAKYVKYSNKQTQVCISYYLFYVLRIEQELNMSRIFCLLWDRCIV